jgi:hypothetical protein
MKCLNCWMYRGYYIWQYPNGFVVEGTNGDYHDTLEAAKQVIDSSGRV